MMATRDIRVEFGDCDPAGIVYYPNYFRMFDNCTAHLFETALGMTKPRWVKHYGVLGIPMVDTGAKFHRPATHGDTVRVESRVTAIGRSSIRIEHKVINGDVLSVEAWEVRVLITGEPGLPETMRSAEVPADIRKAFGF